METDNKNGTIPAKIEHEIPAGYEARIEGNKIIFELKESEDERIRKAILIYLDWLNGRQHYAPRGEYSIGDMISWLEKQGEQNPTWSEGDDKMLNGIIDAASHHCHLNITDVDFLKTLKERYTWKPSDEQMDTLWNAIVYVEGCNSNFEGGRVLENLYSDLKKLKG